MNTLTERLNQIRAQITKAENQYGRPAGSVKLLAVSKTRPVEDVKEAYEAGQRDFGESYLQDALPKIETLADKDITWHFIGPIQSNKTRPIAETFHWVHSVDRLKIAKRLSEQRPAELPPLNICLQVNVSRDPDKAGVMPEEALAMIPELNQLPNIKLRGLMTIPIYSDEFEQQRIPFRDLHELFQKANELVGDLDTLSMGMTGDMEAAIAEGSTMVRIGTAIFGKREPRK